MGHNSNINRCSCVGQKGWPEKAINFSSGFSRTEWLTELGVMPGLSLSSSVQVANVNANAKVAHSFLNSQYESPLEHWTQIMRSSCFKLWTMAEMAATPTENSKRAIKLIQSIQSSSRFLISFSAASHRVCLH